MNQVARVKDLKLRLATKRYDGGLRSSVMTWREKNALLVFVETEDGVIGVGEAWCDGGAPDSVAAIIAKDLKGLVVGQPVWAIEAFQARALATNIMSARGGALYAAVSAIDIALWDALARTVGLPLYRLLGGHASAVTVYGSSGMYGDGYGPDALARDMVKAIEAGCAGVKIKGGGAPLAEDVARVAAVREAIGPDARLMVDILFSLDVPGAIRLGRALRPYDLHFLEAPTARADLRGWAEIRRATGLALAGPELESGLDVFRDALTLGAVDYVQADACVCGGMTAIRHIAGLAQAFHRRMTLHCSGSAVALAANAHAAAALNVCESIEMHLMHQTLFERLWQAGYRVGQGSLHLPDKAGLGIDIAPDDPALTHIK